MTPRLHVEVRVPLAALETLGQYQAVQAYLRQVGLLPAQAQELRWRLDPETQGSLLSYSLPIIPLTTQPAPVPS